MFAELLLDTLSVFLVSNKKQLMVKNTRLIERTKLRCVVFTLPKSTNSKRRFLFCYLHRENNDN